VGTKDSATEGIGTGSAAFKHETVRSHLVTMIRSRLGPNEKLPTERDLCDQLGVSRVTVRRALDQLVSEGVVYRIQGSGTYVSEPAIRKGQGLTSFSEDMRARGLTPGARLLSARKVLAGAREGWKLGVSPGEPLFHIQRIRLANEVPMCVESVWLPARIAPHLLSRRLDESLYDILSIHYRITMEHADQEVRATVLDVETAAHLGVPPLSAALVVERVTFDRRGQATELASSIYRGDRYSLDSSLEREERPIGSVRTARH